jgi:O-succinylbenzoic acid--CoA ligase
VALALPSAELVPALHGCLMLGAVAMPIDLRLGAAERAQREALARLIVTEPLDGGPITAERECDPGETATLMFTSGTTAGPKPVALSYDNWRWNAIGSALALGLDLEERWLCPMPLAHVGGLSIQLRSAIYGTTVVLHERFDIERALAALSDPAQRITLVSLVPTMLARLLDAGLREPPSLRRVLLGGGPIAPALLARARAAGVPVSPSFGMTETCSQIATDGHALFGAELRIAGDGELLVRGPAVAAGALGPDGWLHTGDLGTLDATGRLAIVGRKADTIVTGGENVAPAEVEAALLEHPAVGDAAVLGRSDPEWGEAVVAQFVVRDGATVPEPAVLRAHCAERLAPFKVPKAFELVSELPRSVTGKLLRRELR